ncbi:MAG: CotH kinase family protein, partial [Bacteroidota bacterium]|nr:CotH kinase family protein [Bacteroidota bacterium]
AYLNGIEIARGNIGVPGIIPLFDTYADNNTHEAQMYQGGKPEGFLLYQDEIDTILVQGNNVLAIQVHNYGITSSDMSAIPWFFAATSSSINNTICLPVWFNTSIYSFSGYLPLFLINTKGQEIIDDPRITARLKVINNINDNPNYLIGNPNEYNGQISIEIRGKTSQSFPKKSYSFETQNSDSSNNNISLLGMPPENDWILYAPYSDKSLLRNFLTFTWMREMGNYASRTRFCELFIDEEYRGIYVLMEKIKRDKNRVDINKIEPDDNTGNALTGGYIVKIDRPDNGVSFDWVSPVHFLNGNHFDVNYQFNYPDREDISNQQGNYIQNYITDFDWILIGNNFSYPETGYRKYIDIHSFIDFFIIEELSRDVDAYRLSTFMTKVRNSKGGKYFAGPIWDFNLAYGNAHYGDGWKTDGWALYNPNFGPGIPFYWKRFEEDPVYVDLTLCRWNELKQNVLDTTKIVGQIDSLVLLLGDAVNRNFERWNILDHYVWPNYFVGENYQEEIEYLKSWIKERISWIDANISGNTSYCNSLYEDKIIVSEINYNSPNNFDAGDWFELKNIANIPIDLSGWLAKDNNNLNSFTLPSGTILDPGGFLVIVQDSIKFQLLHPNVSNFIGSFNWKLGSNDQVRLYDLYSWPVLSIKFSNSAPWPEDVDNTGPSLELLSDFGDQNDPYNWFAGCPGGSPGGPYEYPCPAIGISEKLAESNITVFPNPVKKTLFIRVPDGTVSVAKLFSAEGNMVFEKSISGWQSKIDVSELSAGCYYLKIHTAKSVVIRQVVKI